MTQHEMLLKRMSKWTTSLDALNYCGCMRLAARVQEMKANGLIIIDKWVEQGGKRYKSYKLVK